MINHRVTAVAGSAVWAAIHVVIAAASVQMVRALIAATPEPMTDSALMLWAISILLGTVLMCPWWLAARQAGAAGRHQVSSGLLGALVYANGAVLATVSAAGGSAPAAVASVVAVVALQPVIRLRAARVRGGTAARAAVLCLCLLAVWAVWRGPMAGRDRVSAVEAWLSNPSGRLVRGLALAGIGLGWLGLLAAAAGVRKRIALVGVPALSAACWLGYVFAWPRPPAPPEPARFRYHSWGYAEPTGPLAAAASDRALGWRWVCAGLQWREALLVAPPCRVTVSPVARSGNVVRLFAALPEQILGPDARSVRIRSRLVDADGRVAAEDVRDLLVSLVHFDARQWDEISLPIPEKPPQDLRLIVEAEAVDPADGEAPMPVLALAAERSAVPEPGPNCIMIVVNVLRADRLSCYGFPQPTSPHIDRLAAGGTLFEQVESASSWTIPAIGSLLTGTFVATHGMLDLVQPARLPLPSLPDLCRRKGIRTVAVSAQLHVTPNTGFGRGFDHFIGSSTLKGAYLPDGASVTDEAIKALRRLKGRRFFLYLHYADPHGEYLPHPEFARFGWTEEGRYLGEIAFCDRQIGRLLDELDTLGLRRETLIVFVGDHGEAFTEHGFRGHGHTLHAEETRVPLILSYPRVVPAGRRVGSRVRSIDVLPTVAGVMGLDVPARVEGASLLPLFDAGADTADRRAFSEIGREIADPTPRQVSLLDGPYKLILNLHTHRRRLYDVKRDPAERQDLAPERPEIATSMEREIRRFLGVRASRRLGGAAPD